MLCPETFDKELHLRPAVRKRHVVEYEVRTTPHADKVARLDKPLNLLGCLEECETMVLRTIVCSCDGGLGPPKRLPLDPADTGCQKHQKPDQQAHSSHHRYPLWSKSCASLFVNICITKHKVSVLPLSFGVVGRNDIPIDHVPPR